MTDDSSYSNPVKKGRGDGYVLMFIVILCFISAFLLAAVSFSLQKPQTEAREFDQSKQMLVAAKILNHRNFFVILKEDGEEETARFDEKGGVLVPDPNAPMATAEEIKQISALRIRPLVVDAEGASFTLEEKKISLNDYLIENKKSGYANLPLKLIYAIVPNTEEGKKLTAEQISKDPKLAQMYVIPVSGFGLWSAIFGYLAIFDNGNRIVGTTWYEHGETPGLGANITEPWWQKQFYGKVIFQEGAGGTTDYKTAPMGIIVVKGKVRDVLGDAPKSKSAVDGMSGATLTGDGVTIAYRDSLTPYRAFLMRLEKKGDEGGDKKSSS